MHVEIENKLSRSTIGNLIEALEDQYVERVDLFPGLDCDYVTASSLTIRPLGTGYSITASISFEDPLGYTVCHNAGIKELGLKKSQNKLELELPRSSINADELLADIEYVIALVRESVNYACRIRGESRHDRFVLDSHFVSRQLQKSKTEKEIGLRGEKIAPFKTVHADSGMDLSTLNPDLIPIYEEYDKWDLHGSKKAFRLVPRSFATRLLRCEENALISEDQFNAAERNYLAEFVRKGYLKYRKVMGKGYFCALNEKTRLYLVKALRTRAP